jgi:hypothetical protein
MIGLAIYLGVVALLLVGTIRRPAFALGAFLCMFGLEQWGTVKISFIASHGTFTNYLALIIVMIALGVRSFRRGGLRLVNGPTHAMVILLYVYAAATLLWTPAYGIAMEEWKGQAPYLLFAIILLPLLIQNTDEAMEGLLGTVIAGAILTAALAFLVDWGYRQIESDVSADETVRLPLAIAHLGAIVFVIAVLFFRWRGAAALVALGLVAISLVLVVKTGSRGQLISMIVSAMLFLPMSRGWSLSRGTLVGFAAAALAIAAIWTFLPDLSNLLSTQEGRFDTERALVDYEGRVAAADRLLDVYLSSGVPVLLFGLGNSASFAPQVVGFYTHIVPVEILCELGAVGFLLFLAALGFTVRALTRLASIMSSPQTSSESRRAVACLSALALIELLLSFKQGSLVRDVNLFLFPILIEGLLASVVAQKVKRTTDDSMRRSSIAGTNHRNLAVGSLHGRITVGR